MENPYLSIVIPTYNEELRLPETLALIKDFLEEQSYSYEVLIVDDGSKDKTVKVAQKFAKRFPQLRVIENSQNKGKGGVVAQGMQEATGEYRLFADADNSTPITELSKLLEFVPEYSVVIGSRYLRRDSIKIKQPLSRRILSRGSNLLIQLTLLPGVVDTQCGFKLFSAKAAEAIFKHLTMSGWSFDFELLTVAKEQGFQIKEVPVDWFDAKRSTLRATRAASRSLQDLIQVLKNRNSGMYK